MHDTLLQDLAVVMIVAGLVTIVFHRFRQPVVLGYILAGVIIGPHTPPYALISQSTGFFSSMASRVAFRGREMFPEDFAIFASHPSWRA